MHVPTAEEPSRNARTLPDTGSGRFDRLTWVSVGSVASFDGRGPFAAAADGLDLVLVRTDAGLHAFQGRCPHQGALLGEGLLEGETLVCRNHGWRFRLADGCREGGAGCLTAYRVREQDGEVLVGLPAGRKTPTAVAADAARRSLDDLPGPRGFPIVGNALQVNLARLHEILERWAETYGPLFTFRLGPRRVVVVADATLNAQILRARPETYRRLSTVEPVFREMGVLGVFAVEGAAWRPQRRLSMQALAPPMPADVLSHAAPHRRAPAATLGSCRRARRGDRPPRRPQAVHGRRHDPPDLRS